MNNTPKIAIIRQNDGGIQIVMSEQIITLDFGRNERLEGKPIRLSDAASKYNIHHQNLVRWADKGLIRIIKRGPKLLELDEGDVQYATRIYNAALEHTGNTRQAGWALKRLLTA